jgi:hypothetical protein
VTAWDDIFIQTYYAENFKVASAVSGNKVELSSIILAPQALGVPVTKATIKDAATVGIVIESTLTHHEVVADADPSAYSFMLHCRYALQFCWAIAAGKLPSVVFSPSESHRVIIWAGSLHESVMMPHHMKYLLGGTDPSEDTMHKVSVTMTTMAETLAHQREFVVAQSEKKTPGLAKLGYHAKKLILLVSTQYSESEAMKPLPVLYTFLGINSIGSAREHLENGLKAEHGVDFIPSTALTDSLHAGVFIWDKPDLPSHVSYFLCGDTVHLGMSGEESLQLQLKSGGDGLSSSEIDKLANQTHHSPIDFHKAQYQMGN